MQSDGCEILERMAEEEKIEDGGRKMSTKGTNNLQELFEVKSLVFERTEIQSYCRQ